MFQMTREAIDQAPWFPRDEYPFASRFLDGMHYVDEGRGPAVLLVHGTPSWSFEYRHVIAALRGTHRVVAPDHLGFGLSERPEGRGLGLDEHARNLVQLVDHLALDRIHLVVHDFGGPIALPLVETHDVERVTILNSWFWPFEDADPAFAKQKKWVDTALMRFLYLRASFSARMMVKLGWGKRTPLDGARHAQFKKMFPNAESRRSTWALAQAVVHSAAYFEAHAGALEKLRERPVHIVWGAADRLINQHHLARWRALLPAARVTELSDVGHFVADEAAADVIDALR